MQKILADVKCFFKYNIRDIIHNRKADCLLMMEEIFDEVNEEYEWTTSDKIWVACMIPVFIYLLYIAGKYYPDMFYR